MNTLMGPHQGLGALPVNPLLYSLQRDIAHHQSAHTLPATRNSGFKDPKYPSGPPPGPLFHPYRKNRKVFSRSQLLQLEQAFEKKHHVVGQERKTLASKLQLTERQVSSVHLCSSRANYPG
ncbi:hypothetical protein C0Q70_17775 [Pomacea canaliculata]|uniref:Homeobox domain-containing protein n=1 Tax=Pomacea canaliculata TaxID=400727 RepID=A0A2T7NLC9_POMCA|nr:hypothetical protein C0Q70_17775 [Pomacea canaliculata]